MPYIILHGASVLSAHHVDLVSSKACLVSHELSKSGRSKCQFTVASMHGTEFIIPITIARAHAKDGRSPERHDSELMPCLPSTKVTGAEQITAGLIPACRVHV